MNTSDKKRGSALLVALITTLVVGVVAARLVSLALQEHRMSAYSAAYAKVLQAAEGGADWACQKYFSGPVWPSSSPANGDWVANIAGLPGVSNRVFPFSSTKAVITSGGVIKAGSKDVQRTIQLTIGPLDPFSPPAGVTALSTLNMTGNPNTDAYYEKIIVSKTGKLTFDKKKDATAGALGLDGGTAVTGSGSADVFGNVIVPKGEEIVGIADDANTDLFYDADPNIPIPAVAVPPELYSVTPVSYTANKNTITVNGTQNVQTPSINYLGNDQLTISGSGVCRIYVTGTLSLGGTSKIVIDPFPAGSSLKVEIYCDGNVDIGGNGIVNNTVNAANLAIRGTESCTSINIGGNGTYVGTVYAPSATADIGGSGLFAGTCLAKDVILSGSGDVMIDNALVGKGPASAKDKKYNVLGWKELF